MTVDMAGFSIIWSASVSFLECEPQLGDWIRAWIRDTKKSACLEAGSIRKSTLL